MLAPTSAQYLLRKLLTYAALPLGVALALLVLAFLTGRRRWTLAAAALLCLSSLPAVGDRLIGVLEERYPRLEAHQCPPADAIVVLGGIVGDWDEALRIEWSDAVERYEWGVRLQQLGKAPLLILSGGALDRLGNRLTEGDAMREAASREGVPEDAIRVIRDVAVTADEAAAVAELARRERLERVILVTSAFHMPRAVYLFDLEGLKTVPFPVDYRQPAGRPARILDFVPQADGLRHTELTLKEFYGLLYYRVFSGW